MQSLPLPAETEDRGLMMMEGLGILIKCKFVKEASECRLPSLLSLSKCLHENISKETLPIELGL